MACLLRDGFQGNLDAFGEETIMSSTDSHWARSRGSSAGSRRGWWPCEGEGLCRGASGKLGWYLVQHALDQGYEVGAVCREVSVDKLKEFSGPITIIPGMTDDREVIQRAVAGCDGVLTVLGREGSTITHREQRRRCSA
jgi:NAD(P)H-binding